MSFSMAKLPTYLSLCHLFLFSPGCAPKIFYTSGEVTTLNFFKKCYLFQKTTAVTNMGKFMTCIGQMKIYNHKQAYRLAISIYRGSHSQTTPSHTDIKSVGRGPIRPLNACSNYIWICFGACRGLNRCIRHQEKNLYPYCQSTDQQLEKFLFFYNYSLSIGSKQWQVASPSVTR